MMDCDDQADLGSLERYAQVDEDSTRLQQMLEDIRQIAKYGARA